MTTGIITPFIYTLIRNGHLPPGEDLFISLPFFGPDAGFTLLPDIALTVPLILGALSIWIAYRLVNTPGFGDFLIATEAEMNKVSWTPRRRLIQDTIVVLVTVAVLTLFLFLVDMFWGWLLSRPLIGVLPQTHYKYAVLVDRVNEGKKNDVAQALVDAAGKESPLTLEAALNLIEAAPGGGGPSGINAQPVAVATDMDEDAAEALARKLREAGAEVSVKRSRGKQAIGQLRW